MNYIFIDNPPFTTGLHSAEQTETWEKLKNELPLGTVLSGPIFIQAPFGVFFDTGLGFPAMLEVFAFLKEKRPLNFSEDYPPLGSTISGKLARFYDEMRQLQVF